MHTPNKDEIETEARSATDHILFTMQTGMKLKTVMIAKKLRRARAKCPKCQGTLHGSLHGPKNHLHFSCDGTCGMAMME